MTQPPPPGDWNPQQQPPSGEWNPQQPPPGDWNPQQPGGWQAAPAGSWPAQPPGGWNVPPPPAGRPRERIRGARIAAGIAAALGGHLLTIAVMIIAAATNNSEMAVGSAMIGMLIGQVIVFLACLSIGIVLIAKSEPGFGIGLLIGWAIGLLVAPFAGFGLCLYLFSGAGQ
jgi:hypothetical protein